jgi:hypothetical protein
MGDHEEQEVYDEMLVAMRMTMMIAIMIIDYGDDHEKKMQDELL